MAEGDAQSLSKGNEVTYPVAETRVMYTRLLSLSL